MKMSPSFKVGILTLVALIILLIYCFVDKGLVLFLQQNEIEAPF